MSENNTTNSVEKIFTALAKAQGEFPAIPKDSEVEVKSKEGKFLYKYKYAELTTIIDCTRPSLLKNELGFTQDFIKNELGTGIVTIIFHSSGQVLKTGFTPFAIPQNADMKSVAGLFTYAKRISLTAALGVSADEDVDAAGADATKGNSTDKKGSKPAAQKPKDPADFIMPFGDLSKGKPPAQQKAPEKKPEDEKQIAPKDPGEISKNDPDNFVMPFGKDGVKGKKLIELTETTVNSIYKWCQEQMKIVPPPQGIADIVETHTNVKKFLESMGVTNA